MVLAITISKNLKARHKYAGLQNLPCILAPESEWFINQKLDYIHNNPMEESFVDKAKE